MIAPAISLLVILLSVYLLSRAKAENLGILTRITAVICLIGGLVILAGGICRMACMDRCETNGCGKEDHCMMSGKDCGDEMGMHGKMMGKEKCCMMKDSTKSDGNEVGDHMEGKGPVK